MPFNLACSGAQTENVLRAIRGGQMFKHQAPQNDVLQIMASDFDVDAIVVSIGGNDFGFSDIIKSCIGWYLNFSVLDPRFCKESQEKLIRERRAAVRANVLLVLSDVRDLMDDLGYAREDYRLILQTYPSPVPDGDHMRFGEAFWFRTEQGCPLWNQDLTWARRWLVPEIAANQRSAAQAAGAELVDLQDLLSGHEPCSDDASSGGSPPYAEREWARTVAGIQQGQLQESFHPNELGQRALGACMRQVLAARPADEWRCTAGPRREPDEVDVTRVRDRAPVRTVERIDELIEVGPERPVRLPDMDEMLERAAETKMPDLGVGG